MIFVRNGIKNVDGNGLKNVVGNRCMLNGWAGIKNVVGLVSKMSAELMLMQGRGG